PELSGGELFVPDHLVGLGRAHNRPNFVGLPFPEERRGIGAISPLHQRLDHFSAGRVRQPLQLLERLFRVSDAAADRKADEDGPLELELLKVWGEFGYPPARRASAVSRAGRAAGYRLSAVLIGSNPS